MAITPADVQKVALLSRLTLSEEELRTMTDELGAILSYVDQLSEVDTEGVEPMAHAIDTANVFRDDVVQPSLPRDEALANAPKHNTAGYLVPAVLGD